MPGPQPATGGDGGATAHYLPLSQLLSNLAHGTLTGVQIHNWITLGNPTTAQIKELEDAILHSDLTSDNKGSWIQQIGRDASTAASKGADAASKALGLPAFLGELTSRQLWVRVLKVGIGGLLIAIGVAQLTGASSNLKVIPV